VSGGHDSSPKGCGTQVRLKPHPLCDGTAQYPEVLENVLPLISGFSKGTGKIRDSHPYTGRIMKGKSSRNKLHSTHVVMKGDRLIGVDVELSNSLDLRHERRRRERVV
jgi:hypothetical protein